MDTKQVYRVLSSQLVYSYMDIEADSVENAEQLAFESFGEWKELSYENWQIEGAQLTKDIGV